MAIIKTAGWLCAECRSILTLCFFARHRLHGRPFSLQLAWVLAPGGRSAGLVTMLNGGVRDSWKENRCFMWNSNSVFLRLFRVGVGAMEYSCHAPPKMVRKIPLRTLSGAWHEYLGLRSRRGQLYNMASRPT